MTEPVRSLTGATFDGAVAADTLSAVAFFAAWCAPCKRMEEQLDELAGELPSVGFYRVNADEEASLAERFSIQTLPAVLLFRGGCLVERTVGNKTKRTLKDLILGLC